MFGPWFSRDEGNGTGPTVSGQEGDRDREEGRDNRGVRRGFYVSSGERKFRRPFKSFMEFKDYILVQKEDLFSSPLLLT